MKGNIRMYKNLIAIEQNEMASYPPIEELLYPEEQYIELPFKFERFAANNYPFSMLRDCFKRMGFDSANIGTAKWNPLCEIISPGNSVLIKPNLVVDKNESGNGTECLYTQASVVAAVIPYVIKALNGDGTIIIADAPMQECNFEKLIDQSGYNSIIDYYLAHNIDIKLYDLRGLRTKVIHGIHQQEQTGRNGILVSLGDDSEHAELDTELIQRERVTNYDPDELSKHHNGEKHEYLVAKEALFADVIIGMPKPKSHRLAGATISMKNFVGIATRKEYLPHHRIGDKPSSGDEYNRKSLLLRLNSILLDKKNKLMTRKNYSISQFVLFLSKACSWTDRNIGTKEQNRVGAWYGNDTIWRTIMDLNRIVTYTDKHGIMQNSKQRTVIVVADMITIGEHEGPCYPEPYNAGIIAVGTNQVMFDETIATLMGFDTLKMPLFRNVRNDNRFRLVDDSIAMITSNNPKWDKKYFSDFHGAETMKVEPTAGWKGHIELE